jgi:hypothetical protein
MPGKITLTITSGTPGSKNVGPFVFDQHDTLVVGRHEDCQVCIEDDNQVSRHHFLMEVNPPEICIRDLGSRNGTHVNGTKHGGRDRTETAEQGRLRNFPTLELHEGDEVRVGKTIFKVKIEAALGQPVQLKCQRCGRNVAAEAGLNRQGTYLCKKCQAENDPMQLLMGILGQAAKAVEPSVDIQIPDYTIESKLGEGGMGAVYRVHHNTTYEKAALKIMLSKIAVNPEAQEKFRREIEVTRSLSHKHIVKLLGNGSAGSIFYFLIEYCDGGSVYDLMKQHGGHLSVEEAGPIMLQAIEGLAYAHAQHFVHRDLKPQNILLHHNGGGWVTKIADMGLAKNFDQAGFSGMTVTGSMAGTFVFMPREQVTDFKHFKPVSDVWSMGATCYNMLTGQFPRDRKPGQDPLEMVLQNEVVPLRRRSPSIPAAIAEVIDRALLSNVNSRYQNAGEMHKAFTKALERVR